MAVRRVCGTCCPRGGGGRGWGPYPPTRTAWNIHEIFEQAVSGVGAFGRSENY